MKHRIATMNTNIPVTFDSETDNPLFLSEEYNKRRSQIDNKEKSIATAINKVIKESKILDYGQAIKSYVMPPVRGEKTKYLMKCFYFDDDCIQQKNAFDIDEIRSAINTILVESAPIMKKAVDLLEEDCQPTLWQGPDDPEKGLIQCKNEMVRIFCQSLVDSKCLNSSSDAEISIPHHSQSSRIKLFGKKNGQIKIKKLPSLLHGIITKIDLDLNMVRIKRTEEKGHPLADVTIKQKFYIALILAMLGGCWIKATVAELNPGADNQQQKIEYYLKSLEIEELGIKITSQDTTDPVNLAVAINKLLEYLSISA